MVHLDVTESLFIVGTDNLGYIQVYDSAASAAPGWPVKLSVSNGQSSACSADIDQDGRDDLFAASRSEYYGFTPDGEILHGWPVQAEDRKTIPPFIQQTCSIADLEGDGPYEIIGSSRDRLSVWDQAGDMKPGWPVFLPPNQPRPGTLTLDGRTPLPSALADLDDDGVMEIVVNTTNGFLHVFSHDGKQLPGFPIDFDQFVPNSYPFVVEAPLADIDNDGDLEIVAGFLNVPRGEGNAVPRLWAFHHDGSVVDGYPVMLAQEITGLVIADLDGDGRMWILAGLRTVWTETDEAIMVWDAATGLPRPGFPVHAEASNGENPMPLVADVTGDGHPDIVLALDPGFLLPRLYAWDRFGGPIQPYPLAGVTGIGRFTSRGGLLTDLDLDGNIDFLFSGGGVILAATFNRPYDPRTLEWPTLNRDPQHTGRYRTPVDQLDLLGQVQSGRMVLAGPARDLEIPLRLRGQRLALAESLLAGGLSLVAINDREIEPIPVTMRRDGPATLDPDGATTLGRVAGLDGEAVRAAVRDRLERAGACPGPGHVRLELATPTVDRRRVAGQMRLEVIFVPDRERPGCRS